jgi:hypothetical protein
MHKTMIKSVFAFLLLLGSAGCQAGKCGNNLCEVKETVASCSRDCKPLVTEPSRITLVDKTGTGPRGTQLSNGTLIVGFVQNGTDASTMNIHKYRASDFGLIEKVNILNRPARSGYNLGNPTPFQTKSGRLILGFRDHLPEGHDKRFRLRVAYSDDNGQSWKQGKDDSAGFMVESDQGLWEPFFYYDKFDVLRVVYAREKSAEGCSRRKGNSQVIAMKSSADDGLTWGHETEIVGEGVSRDGVPVVARLGDGSYLLVFESWRKTGCGDSIPSLVIRSVQSKDGVEWGKRRIVYEPKAMKKDSVKGIDYPKASWPAVATLADGRVLIAFTTDEDYPDAHGRYGGKEDKQMNERLLMSKGRPTYEALDWDHSSIAGLTPQDETSKPNARFSFLMMNRVKGKPVLLMGLPPRALDIELAK